MKKYNYHEIKVKEMIANNEIQKVIKTIVSIPSHIIIKQVRNPFTNQETNETTQKIHAVAGTSLEDMIELDFTLFNQTIDGTNAINKKFNIVDYNFALDANMRGGNFNGYSPTGLKILVTKIEEIKASVK